MSSSLGETSSDREGSAKSRDGGGGYLPSQSSSEGAPADVSSGSGLGQRGDGAETEAPLLGESPLLLHINNNHRKYRVAYIAATCVFILLTIAFAGFNVNDEWPWNLIFTSVFVIDAVLMIAALFPRCYRSLMMVGALIAAAVLDFVFMFYFVGKFVSKAESERTHESFVLETDGEEVMGFLLAGLWLLVVAAGSGLLIHLRAKEERAGRRPRV